MAYIKPQSPLTHGENFIYPITTHDQIVLPDGSRWDGKNVVDWAQSDSSAKDYVKNRTHWVESHPRTTLLTDLSVSVYESDDGAWNGDPIYRGDWSETHVTLPTDLVVEEGQMLTITIGDKTYQDLIQIGENGSFWIGDPTLFHEDAFNSDFPPLTHDFYFEFYAPYDNEGNRWFAACFNTELGQAGQITLSAYLGGDIYHKLDKNFLPVLTAKDVGATRVRVSIGTIWRDDWNSSKFSFADVEGVTADNNIIVTPTPESYTEYHNCGVYGYDQDDGMLIFKATKIPDNPLDVQVLIFE